MNRVVALLFLVLLFVGCDSAELLDDPSQETEDHIANASRRIDIPRQRDTLRIGSPFRLKAAVDCHNPIIGIRVEITDGSKGQGDGEVLTHIAFPARGTESFEMDTLLTVPELPKMTESNQYGFILVEVYEGREYRAGFEPVVIVE
ncbi:MAG: hypothetical protein KTR29_14715 [Rhodothermaceae bacterium]|nr:hypothetical protein [Rhodothermaceae bacterium]